VRRRGRPNAQSREAIQLTTFSALETSRPQSSSPARRISADGPYSSTTTITNYFTPQARWQSPRRQSDTMRVPISLYCNAHDTRSIFLAPVSGTCVMQIQERIRLAPETGAE